MPSSAHDILKQYWGYEDFRPGQAEIIAQGASSRDVLALLPTGGGKSLCYQVTGLLRGGLTIVVSPLIALMQDQVMQLQRRGLAATFVNSSLGRHEIEHRLNDCQRGRFSFLYLAPERLMSETIVGRLPSMDVRLVAVDEAHCISQWGYDFRPAYRRVREFLDFIPDDPIMAVTATAPPRVQGDIIEQLGLRNPFHYAASFHRPNLRYAVLYDENKRRKMLDIMQKVAGSGIVYLRSRKGTDNLAETLTKHGISAMSYHAGLAPDERAYRQEQWISGKVRVMVATNAFGMGIDKPDVRFVLHERLPADLESYYQEAGRAGRDGETAYAVALHTPSDRQALEQQTAVRFPDRASIEAVYQSLNNQVNLPYGELSERFIPFDPKKLQERTELNPYLIQAIFRTLEKHEILQIKTPEAEPDQVQILASQRQIKALRETAPSAFELLEVLLRQNGGTIFEYGAEIEIPALADQLSISETALRERLERLHRIGHLKFRPAGNQPVVRFLVPRMPVLDPRLLGLDELAFLGQQATARLERLLAYAENISMCRSLQLRRYFGEETSEPCGTCDVCKGRHDREPSSGSYEAIKDQLLGWLTSEGPLPYIDLLERRGAGQRAQREHVLRALLQEGVCRMTTELEVKLVSEA